MQRVIRGVPAADGVALGYAAILSHAEPEPGSIGAAGPDEARRALQALYAVSDDLRRRARVARERGRDEVADILDTSALLAEDPALHEETGRLAKDQSAASALATAVARHAERIAALADPVLASRAEDLRAVGRRAARALMAADTPAVPTLPTVVVARELGPADVTEFRPGGKVLGFAVAAGTTSSHAAIISRALGMPFVVGLGPEVLSLANGQHVCLDGGDGVVVVDPDAEVQARAREKAERSVLRRRRLRATRAGPAPGQGNVETTDGRRVELLCNVNRPEDVAASLASGAPGVGLLRTEVAFLGARAWPVEAEHRAALEPIARRFAGRALTIRTLDFGGDKTPPFLAGERGRGLELTLRHPGALRAQLRTILEVTRDVDARIVFPLVRAPREFERARELLLQMAAEADGERSAPPVGAMIETPAAVACVDELAAHADFLAVGTNDLGRYVLGATPAAASPRSAADPRVLRLVARVVDAAHVRGIPVEVCGESAGEEAVVPLLVGLGVDELSVAPRRIDLVRWVVRAISAADAEEAAARALGCASAAQALEMSEELVSRGEAGDELREVRDGLGGVLS